MVSISIKLLESRDDTAVYVLTDKVDGRTHLVSIKELKKGEK